jgi:hypothetical protein
METFDSQGKVLPIGAADQGILSKKITDKDGQRQAAQDQRKKKAASLELPEKDAEPQTENHLIDIVV